MIVILENKQYQVKLLGMRGKDYYFYFNPETPDEHYYISENHYVNEGMEFIILLNDLSMIIKYCGQNDPHGYRYFDADHTTDVLVQNELRFQGAI